MKKTIITILAGALALCSCSGPKNEITIKGHVQFADPEHQMILTARGGGLIDTLSVVTLDENNDYKLSAKIENPGRYFLDCGHWERVALWAEDEDMTIDFRGRDTAKIKIKNPPFVRIEGSPKNEVMNEVNYNSFRNYQNMIAISQAAYKYKFASDDDRKGLSTTLYDANYEDMRARNFQLLEKYATVTSILSVIETLDPVEDEELIENSLQKLEAAHPGYKPAADLRAKVARERELKLRMMVGQVAPGFSCPTADGRNLGPEDFRGKILLIDFWASWCGPCRGEIPHMKEYYKIFKDKDVEFLSVSIDSKTEAWQKAVSEEGMDWPQVLAPKAGEEVRELYQFNGIPFILLLDKEGRIVAKNLRGEKIKTTIEDLLNGITPEDRAKAAEAATAAAAPAAGKMVAATPIKMK